MDRRVGGVHHEPVHRLGQRFERRMAVARVFGLPFTGFIAWALWLGVHLIQLIGLRNRALVLVNCTWNYFRYDRANRLVTDDVDPFIDAAKSVQNIAGMIVTVPHKFAAYRHCDSATKRAQLLGSVQILRRDAHSTWHGDHLDGEGFVVGIRAAGARPKGQRALLVGAGGAGSAIALALLESGVEQLAIHDSDVARRDALLAKLQPRFGEEVTIGSADPTGYSLIVNATPRGIRAGDPLPIDVVKLEPAADSLESKVYLSKRLGTFVLDAHRSRRQVTRA